MTKIRFRAEWYASDGPQGLDEFDPDLVEYDRACFDTQEQAERYAQMMAADGPADDWWRVEEQVYVPHIYRGLDIGHYETVATWISGEWVPED